MLKEKKKNILRWIFFTVAAVFLYFLFGGTNGLIRLYKLHYDTNKMKLEITHANEIIDSLTEEIEKLKSDTVFIEKIAREKLGMAKKNEKIYKFVKEK